MNNQQATYFISNNDNYFQTHLKQLYKQNDSRHNSHLLLKTENIHANVSLIPSALLTSGFVQISKAPQYQQKLWDCLLQTNWWGIKKHLQRYYCDIPTHGWGKLNRKLLQPPEFYRSFLWVCIIVCGCIKTRGWLWCLRSCSIAKVGRCKQMASFWSFAFSLLALV